MKIYTKTGDKGLTSLFGGKRVDKDNLRIEAYGTVDELNSVLGIAISETNNEKICSTLTELQNELFVLGSDLAAPHSNKDDYITRVDLAMAERLEKLIDEFSTDLPELKYFILPGGTKTASQLHLARTVCRRAERTVVTLNKSVDIGDAIVVYLNRLSDFLFVLARYANKIENTPDVRWQK